MADPIVVSVEIAGAEYIREFEVDPEEQLVKLLQRVADEEQIPLRKKSGHPLVWTAEGPDTREDHAGEWTELTRTQPLSRISEVVVERYGMRSPLFTIRFNIPGAGEALTERREIEKREEIAAKMAQRAAERQAEKSASIGEAEDEFVLDYAAPAAPAVEPPTFRPEPPTIDGGGGLGTAAAVGGAAVAVGAAAARGGGASGGAESRIRRRGATPDGPTEGRSKAAGKGRSGSGKGAGGKSAGGKSAAGKNAGGKSAGGKGKSTTSGGMKKAKSGASGPFAGTPLENVPVWAVAAGAATGGLLLIGLLVMVFSGGKEEPAPEPTPPPPVAVTDIEIATPPPPPPKPVAVVEEVTPPPMEQFYSRSKMVSYQAKEVSAQLTSFTKTNVEIVYSVNHPAPGLSHTISLEGRFKVKISDGGGNMNGKAFKAGVTPGKATRVTLRYDGKNLSVRVGGSRAGSWTVPDSGGFPRWRFDLDPDVEITGLRASAQAEE